MFVAAPRIERVPLYGQHVCHVIDDALLDPGALVDYAAAHAADFAESGHNAYPGPELRMPEAFSAQLDAFFATHLRRSFDARRTERMYSRLAITATPPERLHPRQSLCHVDRMDLAPGQCVIASVLYLFRDPGLGGTAFYAAKRPADEVLPMIADSAALAPEVFRARYGLGTGYMTESNAWFAKVASVPARFNRLIFYEGTVFHSGEIAHPERLVRDPRAGRLTLNGFFTCRRRIDA